MARFITVLSLICLSQTALAMSCPNLSGVFQMAEGSVIKFEQVNCDTLTRFTGVTRANGDIDISPEGQVFQMDGTPFCRNSTNCQYTKATPAAIEINLNYKGIVKAAEHGLCNQSAYKLSLDEKSNLQGVYQVTDCDDGFSGEVTKVFERVK